MKAAFIFKRNRFCLFSQEIWKKSKLRILCDERAKHIDAKATWQTRFKSRHYLKPTEILLVLDSDFCMSLNLFSVLRESDAFQDGIRIVRPRFVLAFAHWKNKHKHIVTFPVEWTALKRSKCYTFRLAWNNCPNVPTVWLRSSSSSLSSFFFTISYVAIGTVGNGCENEKAKLVQK